MIQRTGPTLLACIAISASGALLAQTTTEDNEAEVANQGSIEEQTVTGSFLITGDLETSPLEIIDGEKLTEVPRSTLSDFLRVDVTQNITQDTGIVNSGFQGRLQGNRNASVNLRGLDEENNRVMLDGDRMINYAVPDDNGWRSADVNATIPRIIIRRTELLLDGGSALYGTDAIAGVVNLIPDYGFRGVKLNYAGQHFEQAPELADITIAAAVGIGNDRTSFIAAAEMQSIDAVTNWMLKQDLPDWTGAETNFNYHTWGFKEFNGMAGAPLEGQREQVDPLCEQYELLGVEQLQAGKINGSNGDGFDGYTTCALARGMELSNKKINTDSMVFFAGLEHQFTDKLDGKFNVSAGGTRIHNTYWGNQTFTEFRTINYDNVLVPVDYEVNGVVVTHPAIAYYNEQYPDQGWTDVEQGWTPGPVTQIINFDEDAQGGHASDQMRVAAQFNYALSDSWNLKFNTIYGASEVNATRRAVIADHAIMALRGLGGPNCDIENGVPGEDGCEWFNPFMSSGLPDADELGLRNSRELLDFILPNDNREFNAEMLSLQLLASGEIEAIQFPGGPLGLVIGYEHRWEQEGIDFDDFLNGNGVVYGIGGNSYDDSGDAVMTDYEESDRINAVMVETNLPLLENLRIQLAGRYEAYAGRDSTFNPKIGFNWGPTETLILRGSVGTSYKAPSIAQTRASVIDQSSFLNIGDPSAPNYQQGFASPSSIGSQFNKVTSPNPDLKPQESFNWSVGFDWDLTDNLKLSGTFVSIDFENIVEVANATEMLRLPECNVGIVNSGILRGFGEDGVRDPIVNGEYTGDDVDAPIGYVALGDDGLPVQIVIPKADPSCAEVDPLNGRPTRVFVQPRNLAFRKIEGLDFKASWALDTDIGTFGVRPSATILVTLEEQLHPDLPVVDQVGKRTNLGFGYSKYRANLPISWDYNDHTVTLTTRYISGLERESTFNGIVTEYEPFSDFIYADINWQWQFSDAIETSFYINNIADTRPDSAASIYPRLGRHFGMQISARFGGDD